MTHQEIPSTVKRIAQCKDCINKLGDPKLQGLAELRKEFQNTEVDFKSSSYFDVQIDPRLISTLMRAFGIPPNSIKLHFDLRAATLADRNAQGLPLGGIQGQSAKNDFKVEIYTSLPANTLNRKVEETIGQIKQTHFAMTSRNVASAIIEEIRHVSQVVNNEFDLTQSLSYSAGSRKELLELDYERDAEVYVKALTPLVEKYVRVARFEISGIADWYVVDRSERSASFQTNLHPFLQKDLAVQLFDTDPAGQMLLNQIENLPTPPLDDQIPTLVDLINHNNDLGKIGFVEVRFLLNKLLGIARASGRQTDTQYVLRDLEYFQ